MRALLPLVLGAVALAGCALLGKNEPVVPRYFTAEYDGDAAAAPVRPGLQLRLGRVEGWSHLRERMVTRDSAREVFYSESRRWTERPEVYLRRALSRTLFEERGVVEAFTARAVALEVELMAFEEMEQPRQAFLRARLVLSDGHTGVLEETITVVEPIATGQEVDPARAAVDALSQALHVGVTRIADRAVAKLAEQAASAAK